MGAASTFSATPITTLNLCSNVLVPWASRGSSAMERLVPWEKRISSTGIPRRSLCSLRSEDANATGFPADKTTNCVRRVSKGNAEKLRLAEDKARKRHWKRWGPYLSERQWGTVREELQPVGNCVGVFAA